MQKKLIFVQQRAQRRGRSPRNPRCPRCPRKPRKEKIACAGRFEELSFPKRKDTMAEEGEETGGGAEIEVPIEEYNAPILPFGHPFPIKG